jgi:restriction endonuclease S subunit
MELTKYKLKELCDLQNGYAFKSKDYLDSSSTLSCRMSNIRPDASFDIKYKAKYLPDSFVKKYSDFLLKDGDLIIAMTDMAGDPKILGVPTIVDTKGYTVLQNQRVGKLHQFDEDKIFVPFLKRYLSHSQHKQYYKKFAGGGLQLNISKDKILNLPIEIPKELEDQKKLEKILSDCETLIHKRKESIELLDEFLKSTFLDMFGDPVRNEKGFEMLSGGQYLQKLTVGVVIKPASHYVNDGVIALRSLNIKPNRIELSDIVYFSEESNRNLLSKSILNEGDVVFVRTGNTGTAAIIPKKLEGCNCIDLIISRPNNEIMIPQYLVFFFNSEIGKRIVGSKEVGGIHKHFNVGALKKLKIPVPPLSLQNAFAKILVKTELVKSNLESSLNELESLYGSLSQKAFKGELDLSKVDISQFDEENKPEMEIIGDEGLIDKHNVQESKVNLNEIIKNDFESKLFSISDLDASISSRELSVENSKVKSFLKKAMQENAIEQVYSGDTKQVMFKIKK